MHNNVNFFYSLDVWNENISSYTHQETMTLCKWSNFTVTSNEYKTSFIFFTPFELLKWMLIHTFNLNGYVRLVVNWSCAIAYIVMNIRRKNVFHLCFSLLALPSGQYWQQWLEDKVSLSLRSQTLNQYIHCSRAHSHTDIGASNSMFARVLSVRLFVLLLYPN